MVGRSLADGKVSPPGQPPTALARVQREVSRTRHGAQRGLWSQGRGLTGVRGAHSLGVDVRALPSPRHEALAVLRQFPEIIVYGSASSLADDA